MPTMRLADATDDGPLELLGFCAGGFVGEWPLVGSVTVGRVGSGSDVEIPSGVVSSSHGELTIADGHVWYRDLHSTNGTVINGELVRADVEVSAGDLIAFPVGHDPEHAEFSLVLMHRPPGGWLRRSVEFDRSVLQVVLGRGNYDVSLRDAYVSQRHASFFHSSKGPVVIDYRSTNGVRLNGRPVHGSASIRPGDVVMLGQTPVCVCEDELLVLEGVRAVAAASSDSGATESSAPGSVLPAQVPSGEALVIQIERKNVWDCVREKTLLKDINLSIEPGELVLVLGGSGAGKTTFFNAVMGYDKAQGSVHLGDMDVYEEYESIKYQIGYVPQHDLLRLNDSVHETLLSATMLKMPSRTSQAECERRVAWAASLLGLGREMSTMVGRLSGGQRKRLSIAVELVGDPQLFFLDEPDSGLDGVMSRSLMQNLRDIADLGKMVLVITHGPDRAADLFSKVIVLAKSEADGAGHLVFCGAVDEAKAFFGVRELEGIIRRINRPDEGGEGRADEYIRKWEGR